MTRPALAQEADRIQQMAKKAMDDYDSLEFESAKNTLTECISRLRSAGLDETALAAKVYIDLGVVYIAGFRDRGRGLQQFEKALNIDPTLKLDPAVATPELQEVWSAAVRSLPKRKRAEAGSPPAPSMPTVPEEAPPLPRGPAIPPEKALEHNPLDEVAAGQRVSIYARPLVNVARASLYYRTPGQERYQQVLMGRSKKVPGNIVGLIPAEATRDRTIQYYMEAFGDSGGLVGRQGSAESPIVITVNAGRAPAQVDDAEDPLAQLRAAQAWKPRMYLGLGLGTGGAVIGSGTNTEVAWYYNRAANLYEPAQAQSGGFIWAGLGLQAELGFFVWEGLSIGVTGRFEAYLDHNADSIANAPTTACTKSDGTTSPCYGTTGKGNYGGMGLLKVRYQFRRTTVFRPYVQALLGGGVWRGGLSIDGSKPSDATSPYQPTDVCSATFNGSSANPIPAGCTSVGPVAGFNSQVASVRAQAPLAPLNRVCPQSGACIDSVLLGNGAFGAGAGFYLGSDRIGLALDVNLIAMAGGANFGLIIDAYAGPQIHF